MNLEKLSLTVRDVATKKEKWQKTCWETKRKLGPFQVMTFLSVKICFSFLRNNKQQLPVLHSMNNLLIQTFTLQKSTKSLLFKYYSLVEVIYLLIRFIKTMSFLWNTKNTDRNGVNEQNKHTHHKQRER